MRIFGRLQMTFEILMTRREKRLKEVRKEGRERRREEKRREKEERKKREEKGKRQKRKKRLVVDHHTICHPVFFKTAVFWLRRDITVLGVFLFFFVLFVREWRVEFLQGIGSQILDPVLALMSGPRRTIPSGWFVDVRTESAPDLRAHVGAYDGRRGGCGG